MNGFPKEKFVAHYVIYTDDWFLEDSVDNAINFVDKIVIARTLKPWNGQKRDLLETETILDNLLDKYGDRIEIYEAEFTNEQQQRNFLLEKSKEEGYQGAFIIDADEIFLEPAFHFLYDQIKAQNPKAIRCSYYTFIKDASFTVAPPFETNLFYVSLTDDVHFEWARKINVDPLVLHVNEPAILHFSYLRKADQDIWNKIQNFMHNKDTNWEAWYNEVYRKFNKNLKNFHPIDPEIWSGLTLFDISKFPAGLREKLRRHGKLFYYDRVLDNPDLKLHLGCGDQILDGYINIDLYNPKAELSLDIEDLSYFDDNSVSEIFMNAVFEHLYVFQQIPCLLEWKRILKPNGILRIESIPDFDIYAKAYFDGAPGTVHETFDLFEVYRYTHGDYKEENKIGQMHKDIFNKKKVEHLLKTAGFEIKEIKNVTWGNEPLPYNINVLSMKPNEAIDEIGRAEQLLESGELKQSREILEKILKRKPDHLNALNDLALVELKEKNFPQSIRLLEEVYLLDPENEVALNNFFHIASLGEGFIPYAKIFNVKQFKSFYDKNRKAIRELSEFSNSIQQKQRQTAKGVCPICVEIVNFNFTRDAKGKVNWRESLTCPHCRLNSRERGAMFYLLAQTKIGKQTKLYITERSSPFYQLLKDNFPFITGNDFLSSQIPTVEKTTSGILDEKQIHLNFENTSFDVAVSFEILGRIPQYKMAISEFYRILKPNGTLLLTVPFASNNEKTFSQDENIPSDTIMRNEPVHLFGWDLLSDLRQTGFKSVFSIYYWSAFFGFYQLDNFIIAIK